MGAPAAMVGSPDPVVGSTSRHPEPSSSCTQVCPVRSTAGIRLVATGRSMPLAARAEVMPSRARCSCALATGPNASRPATKPVRICSSVVNGAS